MLNYYLRLKEIVEREVSEGRNDLAPDLRSILRKMDKIFKTLTEEEQTVAVS